MGLEMEKEESTDDAFPLALKIKIFIIQNLGFITGATLMFLLAAFAKNIDL